MMRHKFEPDNGNSKLSQFIEDAELQIKAEQKAMLITERVAYILKRYPSTRGSDNELIARYWWFYDKDKIRLSFPDFKALLRLTRAESIVRFRRWINQRGIVIDGQIQYFRPTPETTSKRRAEAGRVERVMVGAGV
jgi:hypothetical protein